VAAVIGANYAPHARVLSASLQTYHPGARLTILLVDEHRGTPTIPDAEILLPGDIGVDHLELHRRALLFDSQGLVSSLRPLLLAHLLDAGCDAVLMMDVDMLVLAPIDDLWDLTRRAGILLFPHAPEPLSGKPGAWREEELLRSGTFSVGLLGVGPPARDFVAWRARRARRDCLRAPERGLLYTQTWLNLVPAFFEHHVLRDPGVNAQVHSIAGRDIEWDGDRPGIAGAPLRLYHFAGFDPAEPDRLCRHYADERGSLATRPGLRRLCASYAASLHAAGWPAAATRSWQTLPSGEPVDPVMRSAYRDALLLAEHGEGLEPPDPFTGDGLVHWLSSPPGDGVLSRYLLALHAARPDLAAAFPNVPGDDEPGYLRWAGERAGHEFPRRFA
jgi:hypothetical protein